MNRLTWISPIVFIVVMLGGVGIAQVSGAWITSGRQVVAAGQLTVDDVKGSMSLQIAADGLGVTVDDLVALIEPPDRNALLSGTLFKDIEALVPGFELTSFRDKLRAFLAARNGTAAPTATAAAPTSASPSVTATHTSTPTGTGQGSARAEGTQQASGQPVRVPGRGQEECGHGASPGGRRRGTDPRGPARLPGT